MPLPSYRVLSYVYIGPPPSHRVIAPKIAREEHNSYKFIPNTESSWPYDQSLPSKPHFIKGAHGENLALRRTSNKVVVADDYNKYGDFSPQIDDFNKYDHDSFGKWVHAAVGCPPNSFSYVRLPQETSNSGAMISLEERKAEFPDSGDTPLSKYVGDLKVVGRRNNETGPLLSKIENVRQKLNGYLRTRNGRELASYLKSLGLSSEDIGYIGVGFLPNTAIYGVDRTEDGKILFTAAEDAYSKVVKDAKFLGVDPEGLLNSIHAEELVHVWRRDMDKDGNVIKVEKGAKEIVAKHYDKLAEGADGDPKRAELRRRYQKMAAVKRYDRDTTEERYGKKSTFYKELYSKNRAALEAILASEAIDNGYTGDDIGEYVENRLKEIQRDEGKSERGSRLEKIARSEAKEPKPDQAEKEEAPEAEAAASN